ncbi:MAG TPA: tetratricopeptide repeat protein [Thermoanaerobaculia bacterium]|nr:tetratricopeptide repeat protein [Thermoanaerobaculia bacterium]
MQGLRTIDSEVTEALDLMAEGLYADAQPLLARAVAFAPSDERAYELWVGCHLHMGAAARVIALADAGILRGLCPASLHTLKAFAFSALQRNDEARVAAETALALDPTSSTAVEALAAAQVALGQTAAAVETYQQAIARIPEDPDLHFALLELLRDLAAGDTLIESARAYLRKFEKDADVLSILGHAYLEKLDFRRAERAFREAAEIEPDDVERHVDVLISIYGGGQPGRGERFLEALTDRDEELAEQVVDEFELRMAAVHAAYGQPSTQHESDDETAG